MALYRETATGFVQEYASNPGAGYTLISTMPTTSINARAEWWRDLDKWNQTSAWHPSLGSTAQDPNDNFLQIVFTNDSALVSSDANGNVTDGFLGATTQVRVMRGSQNVTLTEGWSFGLAKSPDVPAFTYTWTGTDVRTLQITGFPTDTTSGYIRITATRTGSTTQVKDFKILKVIKGTDGTNGSNGVRGSRQIVVDGTSWSDAAAWNGIVAQTGTTPVLSDLVTIANAGAAFSASKFYTGGAYDGDWVTPNAYINGNLLVTGTVGADKIVSGSITTTQLNFNPVTTGNVVASINATSEGLRISGSRINIDGTVSFGAGYDPTGKISSGGAAGDVNANSTTISGGKITTGSISTAQLNFTPVGTSNIVSTINASGEGLRIASGKIYIDGSVQFGSGYDPSGKISSGGAATDINNNSTTISGGKITTNSIDASSITAGTISADRLVVAGIDATRLAAGSFSGSIQTTQSSTAGYFGVYSTKLFTTLQLPYGTVSRQAVLVTANVRLYNTYSLDGFYIDGSSAYIRVPSGGIYKYPMNCTIYLYKNGSLIYLVYQDLTAFAHSMVAHLEYIDTAGGSNNDYYEIYASCNSYDIVAGGTLLVGWSGSFGLVEFKR
jgi:hypothetical protein